MREAMFYCAEGENLRCNLCPRACLIQEGKTGYCRARKAIQGKLYAINYGETVSLALDPIEKKPLYQFHPHTMILSLGPNSCNLACSFCQNWEISQKECPTRYLSIEELGRLVMEQELPQVAFTYSEPTMWYEYIHDFALAYPDIDIVLVTNGFLNPKPWDMLLPWISAMNIDLKSMRNEFYQKQCNASLAPVLRNIRAAHAAGVHVELTNLLIPGLNDSEQELRELADFIADIDAFIPLHISAYRPCYKLNQPATTAKQIEMACDIASPRLRNVYAGNVYLPKYGRKA